MVEHIDISACDELVGEAADIAIRAHATYIDEREHDISGGNTVKRHPTISTDSDTARRNGDSAKATHIYRFTVTVSQPAIAADPKKLNFIIGLLVAAVSQLTLKESVLQGINPHYVILGPAAVTPYPGEHGRFASASVIVNAQILKAGDPG